VGSFIAGALLLLHGHSYEKGGFDAFPTYIGFPHADLKNWNTGVCFVMEIIGTFLLVWVIHMTVVAHTRPKSDVYGICIGGTVGMHILGIGPITGAALNPQRILGPAVVSGELFRASYDYAWIYYIGDYLGGAIAGLLWYFIFVDWSSKKEIPTKEEDPQLNALKENLQAKYSYPLAHNKAKAKIDIDVVHNEQEVEMLTTEKKPGLFGN